VNCASRGSFRADNIFCRIPATQHFRKSFLEVAMRPILPAVLLSTVSFSATSADDLDGCLQSFHPDIAVDACSRVLHHYGLSPRQVAMTLNNRAGAHLMLGEVDEAIDDLTLALALHPDYPLALYNRALAQIRRERYGQAIVDLDHALKLQPDYIEALHNRGFAHEKLGRYADAIADFSNVIARDGTLKTAYNNRGVAYRKSGQFEQAIVDFSAAITLDPMYLNARLNRAAACEQLGRRRDAIADYRQALERDPSNAEVMAQLQRLSVGE
jgi:tetratricopeptide (TPR) repeat protein